MVCKHCDYLKDNPVHDLSGPDFSPPKHRFEPVAPPRQGLWQNLRAAFAYILLAWALDIMPEPVSAILARGMMSVREELDAYEKANHAGRRKA